MEKIIINPSVIISDSHWLRLIAFAQTHPFCRIEIEFKEGKPYGATIVLESIKF